MYDLSAKHRSSLLLNFAIQKILLQVGPRGGLWGGQGQGQGQGQGHRSSRWGFARSAPPSGALAGPWHSINTRSATPVAAAASPTPAARARSRGRIRWPSPGFPLRSAAPPAGGAPQGCGGCRCRRGGAGAAGSGAPGKMLMQTEMMILVTSTNQTVAGSWGGCHFQPRCCPCTSRRLCAPRAMPRPSGRPANSTPR